MTTHAQFTAETRQIVGSKVKSLRRLGITPAVVYSKQLSPINIQFKTGDFLKLYKITGFTNVIDLIIDGKTQPCLIKDMDVHPYKKVLRHVDFLAVNLKEKIKSTVPVVIIGEAIGVKQLGAVLNPVLDEITIEALPDNIPQSIEIDVTNLATFGDAIRISDIKASKNYIILDDPETLIVNLMEQSVEIEPETPATVVETDTKIDPAEPKKQ